MLADHVDISQSLTQGYFQSGDRYLGNLYISAPGYGHPEDPTYCYRLPTPLNDMPGAARAWFQTIVTFLQEEGYGKVGYEKSMRQTSEYR